MNPAAKDGQPDPQQGHRSSSHALGRQRVYGLSAWALGAMLVHLLPSLPQPRVILALAFIALLLLGVRPLRTLACFGLGLAYAAWAASNALADRLPIAATGYDLQVEGVIIGLPEQQPEQQRFELAVTRWQHADLAATWHNQTPHLRVSWYGQQQPIRSGDHFSGVVRVRPPIALSNPGSFDFERHALAQGLDALAYVRDGRIESKATSVTAIDTYRQNWSRWIRAQTADVEIGALLAGLAVGDQAAISDRSWQRLRVTGTTHLMAISGLHIGLVAAFAAWLLQGVYWLWPGLARHWPRPDLAGLIGLAAALVYASLAGWSLPVLRTILMIALVIVCQWTRRHLSRLQMLLLAAVLALVLDPLAPLSAGFWLSFLGVFSLMLALPGWRIEKPWQALWRTQWVASIFLLPIGVAWFQQASVVGPLTNLLAIPWVTFAVVPLLLLAMLCPITAISGWLVKLAAWSLNGLWQALAVAERAPFASLDLPETRPLILLLAMLAAMLLLTPRLVPGRWLGLLALLPLFLPRSEPISAGQARISVLDVGQGLAVLVQTKAHSLLFDTGARTRGGFDLGEVAVVPALRSLGVTQLDHLLISHLDNDHAGGRQAVLRAYPDTRLQVGIEADPAPRCEQGQRWDMDGVHLEILHPPRHFPDLGNESSCVLLVVANGQRALIPGDIGADIEARLLQDARLGQLDVLVVPHHGSRFSSSAAFLRATQPQVALVSAGFANRFGHPSPEASARLTQAGALLANTASSGMLQIELGVPGQKPRLRRQRDQDRHYWRWPVATLESWNRR